MKATYTVCFRALFLRALSARAGARDPGVVIDQ